MSHITITYPGPPTSGTGEVGDDCTDSLGIEWSCTASGSPGTWVSADSSATVRQVIRQTIGSKAWPEGSSAMARWMNRLGLAVQGGLNAAVWLRLCDSYGSDYVNSWSGVDTYMCAKYNLNTPGIGWTAIGKPLGQFTDGGTVQGVALPSTRGFNGYAQQITSGQNCTSSAVVADGVEFCWLADAGSGATGLQLQVDGVTVQTVDGRSNGHYYYAYPGGLGSHTVGFVNNAVTTCSIDGVYFFRGNVASGYQPWDVSHTGWKTTDFANLTDLAYYLGFLQPHAVGIMTQQNDTDAVSYAAALATLATEIAAHVTIAPSLMAYSNYSAVGKTFQASMQAAAQAWCKTNGAALLDLFPIIGQVPGSGGGADPDGWTIDGIHPSPATITQVFAPVGLGAVDGPSAPHNPITAPSGVVVVSGTAYTIAGTEKRVICTSSSATTITINSPSAMAFFNQPAATGQQVEIIQAGTGKVTCFANQTSPAHSVVSENGNLSAAGQYGRLILTAINANSWSLDAAAAPSV